MGCLSGSMTLQALREVNLPFGWYRVRGQLPSTGGQDHTHTHTVCCSGSFFCRFAEGAKETVVSPHVSAGGNELRVILLYHDKEVV
jgi:hypothetical protein